MTAICKVFAGGAANAVDKSKAHASAHRTSDFIGASVVNRCSEFKPELLTRSCYTRAAIAFPNLSLKKDAS
jgi:hypothetical protein